MPSFRTRSACVASIAFSKYESENHPYNPYTHETICEGCFLSRVRLTGLDQKRSLNFPHRKKERDRERRTARFMHHRERFSVTRMSTRGTIKYIATWLYALPIQIA
jgi:hypothetical protein